MSPPIRLQLPTRLKRIAAVRPPRSLPKNKRFFAENAWGRRLRSEGLLSIAQIAVAGVSLQIPPLRPRSWRSPGRADSLAARIGTARSTKRQSRCALRSDTPTRLQGCLGSEAALKERDVGVETKITTDGLIFGHGDTKGRGVSGPPTPGSRIPP